MPGSIASKHTDSSVFTLKFKRQYLPFLGLDDYNDIGDSLCSLAQPLCCTLYVPCNLRVMDTCTVTEPIAQKQTHLYSIRLHDCHMTKSKWLMRCDTCLNVRAVVRFLTFVLSPSCLQGNKGGVGIHFNVFHSSFCFVNTHFSAHMEEVEKRNGVSTQYAVCMVVFG